jgi:hypothetical protein
MKPLFHLAVRLYPARWRRRYEREFAALLDDVNPGWAELFDVMKGAVTMQIRTAGAIPVACTLIGVLGGGLMAFRSPEVFAASATIHLGQPDAPHEGPASFNMLEASVSRAVGQAGASKAATLVTMHGSDPRHMTVRVTYLDRDPDQAHRVAATLSDAITAEAKRRATGAEVLEGPDRPVSPVTPDYSTSAAAGGAIGLLLGTLAFLLLRSRQHPANVG